MFAKLSLQVTVNNCCSSLPGAPVVMQMSSELCVRSHRLTEFSTLLVIYTIQL